MALAAGALALALPAGARAAEAPTIVESWVTDVTATSANLRARIDPNGLSTTYRFEYLTDAAYLANPPGERFLGAALAPPSGAAAIGAGTSAVSVVQHIGGLTSENVYRYRPVATNSAGTAIGPEHILVTTRPSNVVAPIDGRGWEMVSPVDKGGGAIAAPGGLFGGGAFQAAAGGGALTYSSATAFGTAAGAPPGSQYISRRGPSGWSTENISAPLDSGGYGDEPDGVPYRVFSVDLARALLLNPRRCDVGEPCPRSYSLRESATGALTPLPAEAAGMRVLAASPDLGRILFEDEGGAVWEWSGGGGLTPTAPPPPDTGTERVSPDGLHRLFVSDAEIPPFDNTDADTGEPDTEVYLEGPPPGGGPSRLVCVSCNPTGERPQGSSTIPGALVNGSTRAYKPRVLSASGNRVFFDSSDRLVLSDTNARPDVYEWEAQGEGDCARAPGCVGLVSGGRGDGGVFLDASADGADVYFVSGESLVGSDPGSIDAYDYRVGGGFAEPRQPIACVGDACQALPSPPEDPSPGTLLRSEGNPPPKYYGGVKRKHHGHRHKHRHGKRHRGRR